MSLGSSNSVQLSLHKESQLLSYSQCEENGKFPMVNLTMNLWTHSRFHRYPNCRRNGRNHSISPQRCSQTPGYKIINWLHIISHPHALTKHTSLLHFPHMLEDIHFLNFLFPCWQCKTSVTFQEIRDSMIISITIQQLLGMKCPFRNP